MRANEESSFGPRWRSPRTALPGRTEPAERDGSEFIFMNCRTT